MSFFDRAPDPEEEPLEIPTVHLTDVRDPIDELDYETVQKWAREHLVNDPWHQKMVLARADVLIQRIADHLLLVSQR